MDIVDHIKRAEKEAKEFVYLNNPDIQDFESRHDGKPYILKSDKLNKIPKHIHRLLAKQLVIHLLNKKNLPHTEANIEKYTSEVITKV